MVFARRTGTPCRKGLFQISATEAPAEVAIAPADVKWVAINIVINEHVAIMRTWMPGSP